MAKTKNPRGATNDSPTLPEGQLLTSVRKQLDNQAITALVQQARDLISRYPGAEATDKITLRDLRSILEPEGFHRTKSRRSNSHGAVLARFHGKRDHSYYGDGILSPATDSRLRVELGAAIALAFLHVRGPEWDSYPVDTYFTTMGPLSETAPRIAVFAAVLLVPRDAEHAFLFAPDYLQFAQELHNLADAHKAMAP